MPLQQKILRNDAYATLINRLLGTVQVYGPVRKNKTLLYERITSPEAMETHYVLPTLSPKSLLFPPVEPLFTYTKNHDGIDVQPVAFEAFPERVVFGVRPCDARGLSLLAQTFLQEPKDELFEARRNATTLVGLSCSEADAQCFCNNAAGDPTGSDLLLTDLSNGTYLVDIVTDKGRQLVENQSDLFETPTEPIDKTPFVAVVTGLEEATKLPERMKLLFESKQFEHQSLACIGCGTCTYVCPVCACFDIQDETKGNQGRRIRCWDSCAFACFTVHTSGHNPRESQGQRWRQRLMHKFNYMPATQQMIGCVGCGRCSRSCPVDMNLAHLLTELVHE